MLMKKAVAIIPARGGSKGIPRKNARLLRGKPLIAHAITTAIESDCFSEVFVTTNDPELAEIARRFDAGVIKRSEILSDDLTTLDEVITDACNQLLHTRKIGLECIIATIQATSPLLKQATIKRAVKQFLDKECDTVVSVINEPHLAWTIENGSAVPLYSERSNRQELKPYLRETGGIVICSVRQIQKGSRFGTKVELVRVEKDEAVDIDDYFDWWLAEKALSSKRILFHVVGNVSTGLGHVYRALTLAYRLPQQNIRFVVNRNSELAAQVLESKYQHVTIVKVAEEIDYIIGQKPDLLINDILDTTAEYMSAIRNAGIRTVNFEDRGEGSQKADVLINAMYKEGDFPTRKHAYHGINYCCLRDEFYSILPKNTNGPVKNILLLFGGTDPSDLTCKCLNWIDAVPGKWELTVIIGPGYRNVERLTMLASKCQHKVNIQSNTNVISKTMAEADLAVTSAGRTVFELTAMAVPMVVIAQNSREQEHDFATSTPGAVYLGTAAKLKEQNFRHTIMEMTNSQLLRSKMTEVLRASDVRSGIQRVLNLIESTTGERL